MTNRSRAFLPNVRSAAAAYLAAIAIGLPLVLWTFPSWALIGGLPPGAPPRADFAQHVMGQLYFFSQPWASGGLENLLIDRRLEPPWGANIALTDSMPLLTIIAKLLRPVLPPFDQTITLYQAASWLLQPVAAVFVLRSAGERRFLPALAVGLLAASMPTFLFRLWHAALDGHFFLLIMLGLYLRIVRGSRAALICGCVLQIMLLLVHPYLMFMATALLLAASMSLLLRHDRRWRGALTACILSSCAMVLLGELLGYWGNASDGGFGYYSMNLAAPFWPTFSAFIPGIPYARADGTGGQAEGYQYLGLGLLGLLAVSTMGRSEWRSIVRRHGGLAWMCVALTALAVTNWVFFLHTRVAHIPLPSMLFAQIRGSGRLFWPVAYALLIASCLVTLRRFPRAGSSILLAAALAQFADARQLRRQDHSSLADPTPYPFDEHRLSAILGAHRKLTVLPTFPCNGGGTEPAMDLLWLASRTRMAISSIYMARQSHAQDCVPPEIMNSRPGMDEVRAILPGFRQMLAVIPDYAHDCRLVAPYVLCTRRTELLAGLPAVALQPVPVSTTLPIAPATLGANALLAGWTVPEAAGGVWSVAPDAMLGARLTPTPTGAVRVRIRAAAMPIPSGWARSLKPRPVSVWAGTRRIGDWKIGASPSSFEVVVPKDWIQKKDAVVIELRTSPLVSTLDLGRRSDPRRFGIWLVSVAFTPAADDGSGHDLPVTEPIAPADPARRS